ncbi:MAG: BON domain-containing protein [Jatrophihabitantaceae bacterium]
MTRNGHGDVTLDGSVRSWAEGRQAEHTAWSAPGITGVTNRLRIKSSYRQQPDRGRL